MVYIPFLEIASVWFEPGVIAANIKMLLSTSEHSLLRELFDPTWEI